MLPECEKDLCAPSYKHNKTKRLENKSEQRRHQKRKKVIGLEWKKTKKTSRGYQYAEVFLRDLLTGKKIWSHQMFICTVSIFLFYVKK